VEQWFEKKSLFLAGALGALVYLVNVILGAAVTPGYSHIRHAVSELTQHGASNLVILGGLFVLSALLILVFGLAVTLRYRRHNRRAHAGGMLIVLYGVLAALLATVFPQDPLGAVATLPGTMHLVLAGVAALCIMAAIVLLGLGLNQITGHWQRIWRYSVVSVAIVFVFGAASPILIMNQVALLGLFEHITQLAYLQWFVVLACKSYDEARKTILL
jgi:hypothetical protein